MLQPSNKKITLTCPIDEYDEIHKATQKARSNAKFVKVSKKSLDKLLVDHCKLLKTLEKLGVSYE